MKSCCSAFKSEHDLYRHCRQVHKKSKKQSRSAANVRSEGSKVTEGYNVKEEEVENASIEKSIAAGSKITSTLENEVLEGNKETVGKYCLRKHVLKRSRRNVSCGYSEQPKHKVVNDPDSTSDECIEKSKVASRTEIKHASIKTTAKSNTGHQFSKCSKVFYSSFHLNRHSSTHCDRKNNRCFEKNGESLNKHSQNSYKKNYKHVMIQKKTSNGYPCSTCVQVFRHYHSMKRHRKTMHSNQRPFKCVEPNCSSAFKRKDELCSHLQHVHTKWLLKEYKCQGCDVTFNGKEQFQEHNWKHWKDGTYKDLFICLVCCMGFKEQRILRQHHRNIKCSLFSADMETNRWFDSMLSDSDEDGCSK